jgi:hypothetical protein
MYNNVVFYNRNHNGDVFESREFVKAMMKIIPAKSFQYMHDNSQRILLDVTGIEQIDAAWTHNTPQNKLFTIDGGTLYINTWIGNGKYGCLVENSYDMFNGLLSSLNLPLLPGYARDYLPYVNYSKFHIKKVNEFFDKYKEYAVFIDNGQALSLQADNFGFDHVIDRLADGHSGILFITSQPTICTINRGNVLTSSEIIQSPYDNDLIENGYVSKFCKVIVGKNSGPFVFSGTDANLFDKTKTFISFCYEAKVATFHVNQPVTSKQVWSGSTKEEEVYRIINNEI